jgi:hypothetical protein
MRRGHAGGGLHGGIWMGSAFLSGRVGERSAGRGDERRERDRGRRGRDEAVDARETARKAFCKLGADRGGIADNAQQFGEQSTGAAAAQSASERRSHRETQPAVARHGVNLEAARRIAWALGAALLAHVQRGGNAEIKQTRNRVRHLLEPAPHHALDIAPEYATLAERFDDAPQQPLKPKPRPGDEPGEAMVRYRRWGWGGGAHGCEYRGV